ncbi:MAG: M6 family metalloprotease domain-containing protein [Bacteroidales bacterium]|nr:M6 family metalloprotease domain-containing protein [Bacteroidales bacterium]
MGKTHRSALILALTLSFIFPYVSRAIPARDRVVTIPQPDGTSFQAVMHGDAFNRLMTLPDGCAVVRDGDGWYCYAYFDGLGYRHSSGIRIGEHAPEVVRNESRDIPHRQIAARAAAMRAKARRWPEGQRGMLAEPDTKAGGGIRHGLVILAQFSDVKFNFSKADFDNLLSQAGYSYNGASGSAKDYFDAQFGGKYRFQFTVSEIVTLPKTQAYYGENDKDGNEPKAPEMVRDACLLADKSVDFSDFDDDGDGWVDNVFVFFAGKDEADGGGEECIWSHSWEVPSSYNLVLDGKKVARYACTSEMYYDNTRRRWDRAPIGSFCHEYSHTFNLCDLYDTDYENEDNTKAAGVWYFTSLMDGGNFNVNGNYPPYYNAVEKEILGLGNCERLVPGEYTLKPLNEGGTYLRMDCDVSGEYYLFECRAQEGWDKGIGGSGLLIYHMDKSSNNSGRSQVYDDITGTYTALLRWSYNEVNANPAHQCADLVEADGRSDRITYTASDIKGVFFPSSKLTSFTPRTSPAFRFWSGTDSPLALYDIVRNSDSSVSFTVREFNSALPPNPADCRADVFQDAAIISWAADSEKPGRASMRWGASSTSSMAEAVVSDDGGRWSVTIENLSPRTAYRAEIWFENDGNESRRETVNFTTKSRTDGFEYIYLKSVARNADGSFPEGTGLPLRVCNAIEAVSVVWYWNDLEINVSGDGYFHPSSSGTLKAVVHYRNSEPVKLEKKIVVK